MSGCLVTRRSFGVGLAAAVATTALAQTPSDAAIAVMDTPDNAARFVGALRAKSVRTIVRYYARQEQSSLPEKRMAADRNMIGGEREPAILIRNGFSVVSCYQYRNNLPSKFLEGLPDTGSARGEAEADARAALDQAKLVGQPSGSAIYFGVDFDLTKHVYDRGNSGVLLRLPNGSPRPNTQMIDAVLNYFRTVKRVVGGQFALGVYGNGFANRILRAEGLVSYGWISASRSFEETSDFYNSGSWHLFQNFVDSRWFARQGNPRTGLDIDTNVQNPAVADIGAWGGESSSAARTHAVFTDRRFLLRATSMSSSPAGPVVATLPRSRCVCVMRQSGQWIQVDSDEDGVADGYVNASDTSTDFSRMPMWS